MPAVQETIERVRRIDVDQYKYGFVTDIESDKAPKGLSEDIVRFISAKKNEPEWMLAWRLDAYRRWLTMKEPTWARVDYNKIDYQDLYYYSAPKKKAGPKSLDEIDPEDERATARGLVDRKLTPTVTEQLVRALDDNDRSVRDKHFRRLVGMLVRRGYPQAMAIDVVGGAIDEITSAD